MKLYMLTFEWKSDSQTSNLGIYETEELAMEAGCNDACAGGYLRPWADYAPFDSSMFGSLVENKNYRKAFAMISRHVVGFAGWYRVSEWKLNRRRELGPIRRD